MSPNDTAVHFVPQSSRTTLCTLAPGQFTDHTSLPELVTCPNCRNGISKLANHASQVLKIVELLEARSAVHIVINGVGGSYIRSVCGVDCRNANGGDHTLYVTDTATGATCNTCIKTYPLIHESKKRLDVYRSRLSHVVSSIEETRTLLLASTPPALGVEHGPCWCLSHFKAHGKHTRACRLLRRLVDGILDGLALAETADVDRLYAFIMGLNKEIAALRKKNAQRAKKMKLAKEVKAYARLPVDQYMCRMQRSPVKDPPQTARAPDAPTSTDTPPFAQPWQMRCAALSGKLPHQKRCLLRPLHRGWAHVFDLDAMKDAKDAE